MSLHQENFTASVFNLFIIISEASSPERVVAMEMIMYLFTLKFNKKQTTFCIRNKQKPKNVIRKWEAQDQMTCYCSTVLRLGTERNTVRYVTFSDDLCDSTLRFHTELLFILTQSSLCKQKSRLVVFQWSVSSFHTRHSAEINILIFIIIITNATSALEFNPCI